MRRHEAWLNVLAHAHAHAIPPLHLPLGLTHPRTVFGGLAGLCLPAFGTAVRWLTVSLAPGIEGGATGNCVSPQVL